MPKNMMEKKAKHKRDNVKNAHNIRSRKVEENKPNKHEFMFNSELRIDIRRKNIDHRLYKNLVVKLVRMRIQHDEKHCALKDLNANHNVDKVRGNGNMGKNGYRSDLFEDLTILEENTAAVENTSKTDILDASIIRCNSDNECDSFSNTSFAETNDIIRSKILNVQTSTPLRISNPVTPIVKRLRKNNKKDYRESSLSLTEKSEEIPLEDPLQGKVPIYKKTIPDFNKPKADLYEFDDLEYEVARRRKKRNISDQFDKTMHSILEKIEKKEKKNQENIKRCKNKKVTTKAHLYETKVNAAVEKVMKKMKLKKKPILQNEETLSGNANKENELILPKQQKFGSRCRNKAGQAVQQNKVVLNEVADHNKNNGQNILPNGFYHKSGSTNGTTENFEKTVPGKKIIEGLKEHINIDLNKINDTDDEVHDCGPGSATLHGATSQRINGNTTLSRSTLSEYHGLSNTRSMLVINRSDSGDSFHGFDVEQTSAIEKSSLIMDNFFSMHGRKDTSINIQQNIVLRPAQTHLVKKTSPCDYFIDLHENYVLDNNFGFDYNDEEDDRMVACAEKRLRQTVWRYTNLKRNPYFLFIKGDALPCLSQDLVIDYTLVERLEKYATSKKVNESQSTENPPACLKLTYQRKILDYIESPLRIEDNYQKEAVHSSLYDYEEFVIPVKPRRVLGVLQNEQIMSTPKKHFENRVPIPDISVIEKDNDPINEDAENTPPERTLQVRLDKNGMQKYSKKSKDKQEEVVKQTVKRAEQQILSDSDDDSVKDKKKNETDANKDKGEIQLFDEDEPELLDMSITIPKMTFRRKRRRRKSEASEIDDAEYAKTKKKKKDMMTKEEEMEFEQWASKFNAMCEEVDRYELEVD